MLLVLLFLVLGLAWAPNIMAQELSCSPSNNGIVIPSPTTVHSGEEIVWTISIQNNNQTNYAPIQGVPALLVADGSDAFHQPLEMTMAVGRPGTFTFINCTDLVAGMDHCEIKPGDSNIVLLYTTAEGVAFAAEETITIGKVHATAVTPVPTPTHVVTTNIVGFYYPLEALGVFETNGPLCNPQVHSGTKGTTIEFFPPTLCIAPPFNLISWWPGDGDANDIVDENHGTLQNGATFGAGLVGQAFYLDGVDDFVMVPNNPSLNFGTNDFTVDLWVKFNTLEGEQILIEKYIETFDWTTRTGWDLTKLSDNIIRFGGPIEHPAAVILDVVPPSIPTDTWIFVAITRNGNTYTLYWNGVAIGEVTTDATLNLNSTASLKFGHRGNPEDTPGSIDTRGFYLNGFIDEVEIFNRALSLSEIVSIYNAWSAGKCKIPDISVSPTSHNFGSVNIGASSAPQTFTISNTGTGDLIVSSIDLSDITNYTIDKTGCGILPATITPGNNCTVTVTFSPSSTGTKNATLTITSDDPDTTTLDVPLSGTGQMQTCFSNSDCNFERYCKKPEGDCSGSGVCAVKPEICLDIYFPVCGCDGVTYSNECVAARTGVSVAYQGECILPIELTLLIPNGGEVLPSGGTYGICWEAPNNVVKFDLSYSTNNGTNWNFIKSVTGLNCTHWEEVPVVTVNKKTCRVKVIGYDSNSVKVGEDISDKPFTIDVVRVTSPNGGQTLKSGDTSTIQWTTNKTIRPVAKTVLKYTTDGTTWKAIKTLTGIPGNYLWKVPVVSSTKCKVKVILKDASGVNVGSDVSDKFFTIQP